MNIIDKKEFNKILTFLGIAGVLTVAGIFILIYGFVTNMPMLYTIISGTILLLFGFTHFLVSAMLHIQTNNVLVEDDSVELINENIPSN